MQNQRGYGNISAMNIQDFLRSSPMKGLAYDLYRERRSKLIANRILALVGLIRRKFSLREAFFLFLPTRFKSKALREKFTKFLNEKISEEVKLHIGQYINSDGSITLYGNPFYPANGNYGELMEFLYEVIVMDQYSTHEFLKDGDVVIDAGANIGSFSVLSLNSRKNISVYAFEPVNMTFSVLKKNTAPYIDIHCYKKGLGNVLARQKIYISDGSSAGSTFVANESDISNSGGRLSEEVDVDTIDNFVVRNSLNKVDLIKMDTEGYEFEILSGARETIKKFGPVIVASAYHKPNDKIVLPQLVKSINPLYESKLLISREDDIVFYIKK